ncbi:MAG: c-type cytochrome [Fulvimonas sp.]|nr:c-type cytochrome [Fulvimonas sp.]
MSFSRAGFRSVALGVVAALIFAWQGPLAAQDTAKPGQEATPASGSSTQTAGQPASEPAPAGNATAAAASGKPGDAAAGQGKAAACGACHGMDGNSSDPQYPKLAGQHEDYIVRQLTNFKANKRQNPIMLGMATPLSEQDMHDIGAYFASKQSLPGVADAALVERGQQLFREGDPELGVPACMACHGIAGRGNPGAKYPQLTSQHAQYVQAKLKDWHDGVTWSDDALAQIMPTIAKKLSEADIAAVASYIEGLHPADAAQPAAR